MKMKRVSALFSLAVAFVLTAPATGDAQSAAPPSGKKPNILVIFGDDIGQTNVSAYSIEEEK
jgi:hypothetical protein